MSQRIPKIGRPVIEATSIHDLNRHYLSGSRWSLAVSSRSEQRGGQWFGLGGLDWTLVSPAMVVTLTTGEDEQLPSNLPVVRDGWPFAISDGGSAVAA
jgi:hypothetical protein